MYPPGHVAFSYLLARRVIRNQPTATEFAALTLGTLFPAASNVALQYLNVFGLNHFWSHSPVLLVPLVILGILAYGLHVPHRRVPLLFAFGVASHLINDMISDFPLLYFSDRVDDMGGPWFFPWRPIIIEGPQLEPGFEIQPWELIFEGVFLLWTLGLWSRRDLGLYSALVVGVTLVWILHVPGYV